jgi:hypothetical protein
VVVMGFVGPLSSLISRGITLALRRECDVREEDGSEA